jgi:hypothetical protein
MPRITLDRPPFDPAEPNYCFVTGVPIPSCHPRRFTFEFDAWVSKKGQQIVYASSPSGETELSIIHREWLSSDGELLINQAPASPDQ